MYRTVEEVDNSFLKVPKSYKNYYNTINKTKIILHTLVSSFCVHTIGNSAVKFILKCQESALTYNMSKKEVSVFCITVFSCDFLGITTGSSSNFITVFVSICLCETKFVILLDVYT